MKQAISKHKLNTPSLAAIEKTFQTMTAWISLNTNGKRKLTHEDDKTSKQCINDMWSRYFKLPEIFSKYTRRKEEAYRVKSHVS